MEKKSPEKSLQLDENLLKMAAEARKEGVPVMQDQGLSFICDYIRSHQVHRIIEIGSAVGCSAILFASQSPKVHVITVEIDRERYEKALQNIKNAGMEGQVQIILGDALKEDTLSKVQAALQGKEADLIFLDGAKSQYISFFEDYQKYLAPAGAIISDNLLFHGMTAGYRKTYNYNTIKMLRKIRGFIIYLKANPFFQTSFYTLGDGLSLSVITEEGYRQRGKPSPRSILLARP